MKITLQFSFFSSMFINLLKPCSIYNILVFQFSSITHKKFGTHDENIKCIVLVTNVSEFERSDLVPNVQRSCSGKNVG
jgi:Na+/serine symporter